jgi:hypothetical protein
LDFVWGERRCAAGDDELFSYGDRVYNDPDTLDGGDGSDTAHYDDIDSVTNCETLDPWDF